MKGSRPEIIVLFLATLFLSWPLGVMLSASLSQQVSSAQAQHEYTYYGYVPREIWSIEEIPGAQGYERYRIAPNSTRTRAYLAIIGNVDDTTVAVHALPETRLIAEFNVDRLENVTVALANGTFFKTVSSKPVTAILMGGWAENAQDFTMTFFTSVDGSYVGKEFVFQALLGNTMPGTGPPYQVHSLEDSHIIVYDVNESKVLEFDSEANEMRQLALKPAGFYRLVSTGYVLLQSFIVGWGWDPYATVFYPSVHGGFLGKVFHGAGFRPELVGSPFIPAEFYVTSTEDAKVSIVDLGNKRRYDQVSLTRGEPTHMEIRADSMALESDREVLLMHRASGLAYGGLKAGQTAYVYVPTEINFTGEAYLFASKPTTVTIDDIPIRLAADDYAPLQGGLHRITASENVVFEVVNWARESTIEYTYIGIPPKILRLSSFGACLPSVEAMSIAHEDLRLKPAIGEEMPWAYIGAAVAVVAAVVAAFFLRSRRGHGPTATP